MNELSSSVNIKFPSSDSLSEQSKALKKSIYMGEQERLEQIMAEQKAQIEQLTKNIKGYEEAEYFLYEHCSDAIFNRCWGWTRRNGEPCINYLNRVYREHDLRPPFEDIEKADEKN